MRKLMMAAALIGGAADAAPAPPNLIMAAMAMAAAQSAAVPLQLNCTYKVLNGPTKVMTVFATEGVRSNLGSVGYRVGDSPAAEAEKGAVMPTAIIFDSSEGMIFIDRMTGRMTGRKDEIHGTCEAQARKF